VIVIRRCRQSRADIKAAILAAFDEVGGAAYLERQAEENPVAFMRLLAKVLPLQVTGNADASITIRIVKYAGAVCGHPAGGPAVIEAALPALLNASGGPRSRPVRSSGDRAGPRGHQRKSNQMPKKEINLDHLEWAIRTLRNCAR
jgi:hypothetical protein